MSTKQRHPSTSLLALIAEGFLSRLSFGLITFALPLYAHHLGLSLAEVGFLVSLELIVGLALKPAMGWMADRFGLKRSLTAAIGMRSLIALLLGLAGSAGQLYAIRSAHGLSKAIRDPAVNALIAEHGGKKTIASQRLVLMVRGSANILSSLIYLGAPNLPGLTAGRVVDDLGKAAFRPAWGALMAHVSSFDKRGRARTMGLLSMGEDAGEIVGPIMAGLLWNTWGITAMLGTRAVLAVLTEAYAVVLTRSLGKERLIPGGRQATVGAQLQRSRSGRLISRR